MNFLFFPSSLQEGKIYLIGTVNQPSAPVHPINQKTFAVWEYSFSGKINIYLYNIKWHSSECGNKGTSKPTI